MNPYTGGGMNEYACICINCREIILVDLEIDAQRIADAIAEDGCETCGCFHGAEVFEWE